MNGKLWAIVRREYLERVRTKAFVIGTVLGPLILGALMLGPMLAARASGKLLRVAVLDRTGTLGPAVEDTLRRARFDDKARFDVEPGGGESPATREAALKKAVLEGRLDGYLVIPEDALAKSTASYFGRNVSNRIDLRTMERAVSDLLVGHRLTDAGLESGKVKALTRELELKTIRLSEAGEREDRGMTAMLASIIMMTILYTSIIMWGQIVMTSIIEEKSSRVVEVMASGVPATTLLTGKLVGVGGAGLTQFLVWSLSLFGISLAAAGPLAGALSMPEITPVMLVSFVLFFLLGFFFYATLYAAIGAAVNTVQEAQNLMWPVLTPIIIGMVSFTAVLEAPDGALSVAMSMIPGISPLIMFLRIVVSTPPLWQIALSIVLLLLGIFGVVRVAARIYRVGILMYGKKATFPELMRWVRHS
ncbi:MAG TPA: ABC transporter permease [Vicinamibacteria bacterium]|nr:ABC transporter permease [Vicinamibacteria bacterium]